MPIERKRNVDDVFIRSVIVATLGYMRDKLVIRDALSDGTVRARNVPFFVSLTGDERYLQDAFFDWMSPACQSECVAAEGNYDPIPRGILKLTETTIRQSDETNPYIRSTYTREEDGMVKQFSAMTRWCPLTMTMDVEIRFDEMLDYAKSQEEIFKKFYKSEPFKLQHSGFQVPCQVQFPEGGQLDKPYEFTSDSNAVDVRLTFQIEIETYLPDPDFSTEFFMGNNIREFKVARTDDGDIKTT